MRLDMQGKVAIVTGADGARGAVVARRLAESGAMVVVAGAGEAVFQVADDITAEGGQATAVRADTGNREDCVALVQGAVKCFGGVHCLINAAAATGGEAAQKNIEDYDDALWHSIIKTNLTGVYACAKQVILQMEAQGQGGSIVNIGSLTGLLSVKGQGALGAAEAGVFHLTRAMANELAPLDIRVNAIAVGALLGEDFAPGSEARGEALLKHIPMHRTGRADEVANLALFMASDAASYMTGAVVPLDGGLYAGYARDF